MALVWQVGIIVALIAALASVAVALIGRGTTKEANAVAFSRDLLQRIKDLESTVAGKDEADKIRDARLGLVERVLDAALDHIDRWRQWNEDGHQGMAPKEPHEITQYRKDHRASLAD